MRVWLAGQIGHWRRQLTVGPGSQQLLLLVFILAAVFNTLLFYAIPVGHYDRSVHLWHAAVVLAALPVIRHPARMVWGVNVVAVPTWLMLIYIAAQTGGMNSTALIWYSLMVVLLLVLVGAAFALGWLALILVTFAGLAQATYLGWIDPRIHVGPEVVPWTLMNYVLVTVTMMFSVLLFEYLQRSQLQELQRRNRELQDTHEALIRARAHKDEFLAAVSHELRTPMNAILGFNGVLRHELAEQPEQLEVIDHIRDSTTHLLQVVNDILDFSQLQAGRMRLHLEDFLLAELVDEALRQVRTQADRKGLQLQADTDPHLPAAVHGDRQRLLQVLHKLLENAVKFTDAGRVDLRLCLQQGQWRIEVQDTGCGMSADSLEHIFNRFEHVDVRTQRARGGPGLGLALSQRLTQLMGGALGVDSQPGRGTLFWLVLPLVPAAHAPLRERAPQRALSGEALRILVVDDNAVNLQVARLQLHKVWPQAQLTLVDSAQQALAVLNHQVFDVALVDMVMPEMDGLQLTQEIRRQFADLPMAVLGLTANTNPAEHDRCLAAGMDDVLHKPIDTERLQAVLAEHVHRLRGAT